MFSFAIVRPPASSFANGITTSQLGSPDYSRALEQHSAYCNALIQCGLTLTQLEPDDRYPDSTFIEDTAVIVNHQKLSTPLAVIARPGAPSRVGEVLAVSEVLDNVVSRLQSIREPGTLDAGDVCQAGNRFFVGWSARTNEPGARQLSEILATSGFEVSIIDIREQKGLLHLKSGLAFLGDNKLVVADAIANKHEFSGYELVHVKPQEEYAANCIRVNDYVLIASGFPIFDEQLKRLGYNTIALDMSEFQKMDGGLSCLSLRF